MPQIDLDARWGRMKNGYRQNSFGFGQLLQHSTGLKRMLRYQGNKVAAFYRAEAPKGREAQDRSANDVKVVNIYPGGKHRDRMEVRVKAKPRNAAGMRALGRSTKSLSGGRTVTPRGQVSG